MRQNYRLHWLSKICCTGIFALGLSITLKIAAYAQDTNTTYKITIEDVVSSARANDLQGFENIAARFRAERKQLNMELLYIFKDGRSSNLNQCAAAYYLGEIRASESR